MKQAHTDGCDAAMKSLLLSVLGKWDLNGGIWAHVLSVWLHRVPSFSNDKLTVKLERCRCRAGDVGAGCRWARARGAM